MGKHGTCAGTATSIIDDAGAQAPWQAKLDDLFAILSDSRPASVATDPVFGEDEEDDAPASGDEA